MRPVRPRLVRTCVRASSIIFLSRFAGTGPGGGLARPRLGGHPMIADPRANGSKAPTAPPPGVITPPHNLDAEQSVLGAILLSDRSLYALVIEEGLRAEDFYRERHGIDLRGDARAVQRKRAGGRADGHRPPAPDGQARGGRRRGDRGRADRGRAGRGPRPPLRADRARERAAAAPAEEHVRDPGERARATTRRRASWWSRPRRRCSRSRATTASRTSARSRRCCTRSSTSCTGCRSRAPR